MKLGVTLDAVKSLFFTHYHIDHTAGYADLLSRGSQANGPDHNLKTLNVYGPDGPRALVKNWHHTRRSFRRTNAPGCADGRHRGWVRSRLRPALLGQAVRGRPPFAPGPRPTVTAKTITANSPTLLAAIPVLSDQDMRVEAIEVDHDEDFGTCYAYRFTLLDGGVGAEVAARIVVRPGAYRSRPTCPSRHRRRAA